MIRMRCPLCKAEREMDVESIAADFPSCGIDGHDLFPVGAVGRPDVKFTIHRAKHQKEIGQTSPLCADVPTPIEGRYNYWSIHNAAVNCTLCLALIQGGAAENQH